MHLYPSTFPLRDAKACARFEAIDTQLRGSFLADGAAELQAPALIAREVLEQAEVHRAFPHLLIGATTAREPELPPEELFNESNLACPEWFLSPAVCYHSYAHLAGRSLSETAKITARGSCFRNEDRALIPGNRQIEFSMRELVFVGQPDQLAEELESFPEWIENFAHQQGLQGHWEIANDPFFLPVAEGKAAMQRLLGTKQEFVIETAHGPLAIASINRHGSFFGERFQIRDAEDAPAETACVAFGLDRWSAYSPVAPETPNKAIAYDTTP